MAGATRGAVDLPRYFPALFPPSAPSYPASVLLLLLLLLLLSISATALSLPFIGLPRPCHCLSLTCHWFLSEMQADLRSFLFHPSSWPIPSTRPKR